MAEQNNPVSIYFKSLSLENVRCFKARQTLRLTDGEGRLARWTLILGDNGLGKTTLLECLAWMRPEPLLEEASTQATGKTSRKKSSKKEASEDPEPIFKGSITPVLPGEENDVLESLLRTDTEEALELTAELTQGQDLRGYRQGKAINTGIRIFGEGGVLNDDPELFGNSDINDLGEFHDPNIIAYGANRQMGVKNVVEGELEDTLASRLSDRTELYDAEEILNELDYAAAKKKYKGVANRRLQQVKTIISTILPRIDGPDSIEIHGPKIVGVLGEPSGIRIKTFTGSVPLSALSLGYQTTLAWAVDLAWRLIKRYPDSTDPLAEPAVVIVDEIDLHLHPRWQRTIMAKLTGLFPKVQFIATAHSPLMVQAVADENIVVLQEKGDHVTIVDDLQLVKGWRVDQILTSEYFGVSSPRDEETENRIRERNALANKRRTPAGGRRLKELENELASLPTAEDEEGREAMNLIKQAAALLKSSEPKTKKSGARSR